MTSRAGALYLEANEGKSISQEDLQEVSCHTAPGCGAHYLFQSAP